MLLANAAGVPPYMALTLTEADLGDHGWEQMPTVTAAAVAQRRDMLQHRRRRSRLEPWVAHGVGNPLLRQLA